MKKAFVLQPDILDERDFSFRAFRPFYATAKYCDLRPFFPAVTNQGSLGSCAANAANAYVEYLRFGNTKIKNRFSRLFLYYNVRKRMNTIEQDSGCYLREVVKSLNQEGVCFESRWKYIISFFKKEPAATLYDEAKNNTIVRYERVPPFLNDLKLCLSENSPILFGAMIYKSMMTEAVKRTGVVPLPGTDDDELLGGHAMLIVGFDEDKKHFIVRNSWGKSWGNDGYCYFPYAYIANSALCFDFWKMSL